MVARRLSGVTRKLGWRDISAKAPADSCDPKATFRKTNWSHQLIESDAAGISRTCQPRAARTCNTLRAWKLQSVAAGRARRLRAAGPGRLPAQVERVLELRRPERPVDQGEHRHDLAREAAITAVVDEIAVPVREPGAAGEDMYALLRHHDVAARERRVLRDRHRHRGGPRSAAGAT